MKVEEEWLSSIEARKFLRVSDCDLMHMRTAGQIEFKKTGNAFLYSKIDLKTLNEKDERKAIKNTV